MRERLAGKKEKPREPQGHWEVEEMTHANKLS